MESSFSQNYFELFNLPPSYDLDCEALTQRYREMQGVIHPDRFVNATEKERRMSVQLTALINEAYQVLKAPLTRAKYLLQLRAVEIDESVTNKEITFLTEQIELRERLEEICHSADVEAGLTKLGGELQDRLAALQQALQIAFQDDSPEALESAHRLYDEMQFISRLNDEVDEIDETFG